MENTKRKKLCAFSSDASVLAFGRNLRELKANALEALHEQQEYMGVPLSPATDLAFTFRKVKP